jgi:hypothetical protein
MQTLTDKQKKYLDLIKTEPYLFGKWNGFNKFTKLHNEWIKSFIFDDKDQTLQAHRGSYKSTSLSVAIALMIVIYPNKSIIFIRKTDDNVTITMNEVTALLRSDVFRELSMVLYGRDLWLVRSNASEITTNLKTSSSGASQLIGLGIKTSITGKHADIIITDDIVTDDDRSSRAGRELTKRKYRELQNIRNRGGRFINTGTPWHKEDCFSLMPNITRYDCYTTGLINKEQLKTLRESIPPPEFAANYELKHIANDGALFTTAPQFTDKVELIYDSLAHIDASYGGDDGTSYTILKKQPDNTFVGFGKRWDKHVSKCLDEIKLLHENYRAGIISVENNADKGYLAKELQGLELAARTYNEKQNKYSKISTYLYKNWGKIKWLEETDRNYLSEILDYNIHAEHDDSPDSAASLLRYMEKGAWLY